MVCAIKIFQRQQHERFLCLEASYELHGTLLTHRPAKDGKEPNNWRSFFGGSSWEFDSTTGEHYLVLHVLTPLT